MTFLAYGFLVFIPCGWACMVWSAWRAERRERER